MNEKIYLLGKQCFCSGPEIIGYSAQDSVRQKDVTSACFGKLDERERFRAIERVVYCGPAR